MKKPTEQEAEEIVNAALNVAWKRVCYVIGSAAEAREMSLKSIAQTIYLLGAWDGANLPEIGKLKTALLDESEQ